DVARERIDLRCEFTERGEDAGRRVVVEQFVVRHRHLRLRTRVLLEQLPPERAANWRRALLLELSPPGLAGLGIAIVCDEGEPQHAAARFEGRGRGVL